MKDKRYLVAGPPDYLTLARASIQPIIAKKGRPNIDLTQLAHTIEDFAVLREPITVESPEHWKQAIEDLGDEVDALLPVSIPAYPTEIWNERKHRYTITTENLFVSTRFSLKKLVHRNLPFSCDRRLRYEKQNVSAEDLSQAVRTYLAINAVLEQERALGFGVNCFRDLIIEGGRDVPCLAQVIGLDCKVF